MSLKINLSNISPHLLVRISESVIFHLILESGSADTERFSCLSNITAGFGKGNDRERRSDSRLPKDNWFDWAEFFHITMSKGDLLPILLGAHCICQPCVGSMSESGVPREKTFRPESIGYCLDGHPPLPFG